MGVVPWQIQSLCLRWQRTLLCALMVFVAYCRLFVAVVTMNSQRYDSRLETILFFRVCGDASIENMKGMQVEFVQIITHRRMKFKLWKHDSRMILMLSDALLIWDTHNFEFWKHWWMILKWIILEVKFWRWHKNETHTFSGIEDIQISSQNLWIQHFCTVTHLLISLLTCAGGLLESRPTIPTWDDILYAMYVNCRTGHLLVSEH